MSYVAFHGEKRVGDLVTRIWGKLKPADARRAAAALVAANPELDHPELLERGRPIAVPSIPGSSRRPRADTSAPLAEGVDGLRASVARYVEQLGESIEQAGRDIDRTRETLESEDLRRIAGDDPAAGELLEQVGESLTRRAADVERSAAFMRRLRKAESELAELGKAVR